VQAPDSISIKNVIEVNAEEYYKPMIAESYEAPAAGGEWSIKEKAPVCIKSISETRVEVTWQKSISGQFTLVWTNGTTTYEKIIVVESLF